MVEPLMKEKNLEDTIEDYLVDNGYITTDPNGFDHSTLLVNNQFIEFITTSQPDTWEKYSRIYGTESEKQIISRFNKEVHENGLLKVLRRGINDHGKHFDIAYYKPETSMNQEASRKYDCNILSCSRQFHYTSLNNNSIDIVLLLNGIPIISIELKNEGSGQNIDNAKAQFKYDRDPKDPFFTFNQRNLVYFCADTSEVWMTTRLQGERTKFLPFNQGSNGAGNVGGKGNPVIDGKYATSYLWENVLQKDSLMDIIKRFIHYQKIEEKDKNGKRIINETMIFPRYHQLDVVRKLINDVKINGPGKNYLIMHSAGSGKSNSIAWLAHRLSGLHDCTDQKIFDSVIVITDRKVLDSQLQDTIDQFDHQMGVVVKIDKNSNQLKDAINEGKSIIITTLQKFPVIYEEVDAGNRNFAIICDEAHSSQTGLSANKLKEALGDRELELEESARLEEELESKETDPQDKLAAELASHGRHKNLSFFAFTATPKDKTMEIFGTKQSDGKYLPFHIYSMRQAIEEGFILDVLKNYTTYEACFKMKKKIKDDPRFKEEQATKAILKYETLHPHNIRQKTEVMVEFFRNNTRYKINGHAKAMVVTSSRLHAVRYYYAFKDYLKEKGYNDMDVLVAFSGEVKDHGVVYIEEGINKNSNGEKIKESQLPSYFHDSYQLLIVADKYQTGFDEPYLQTMFVDKKLYGVKAVQTLSRLNRTAPGKDDTFILDFINDTKDIENAFNKYYEETILDQGVDPNIIYDIKNRMENYNVWTPDIVRRFGEIFYSSESDKNKSAKLSSLIKPSVDAYFTLDEPMRRQIRADIAYYLRIYMFIIQIERMNDEYMQMLYVFLKYLYLYTREEVKKISIDDAIALEYYRLTLTSTGSIELKANPSLGHIKGTGGGPRTEEEAPLSKIIEKINAKFGTDFDEGVDVVINQIADEMISDQYIVQFAKDNNINTFDVMFKKKFEEMALDRYLENDKFFSAMMKDERIMEEVSKLVLRKVYMELKDNNR